MGLQESDTCSNLMLIFSLYGPRKKFAVDETGSNLLIQPSGCTVCMERFVVGKSLPWEQCPVSLRGACKIDAPATKACKTCVRRRCAHRSCETPPGRRKTWRIACSFYGRGARSIRPFVYGFRFHEDTPPPLQAHAYLSVRKPIIFVAISKPWSVPKRRCEVVV